MHIYHYITLSKIFWLLVFDMIVSIEISCFLYAFENSILRRGP